jgi:hypothetical protein
MAVQEKLNPTYMSIVACVAALAVTGWLAVSGERHPRRYTSHMAINHHNGYGREYACRECHVPGGGFFLTPTCVTSSCHGELQPETNMEQGTAMLFAAWREAGVMTPSTEEEMAKRAEVYLKTHRKATYTECWDCHSEHQPQKLKGEAGESPSHATNQLRAQEYPSALASLSPRGRGATQ